MRCLSILLILCLLLAGISRAQDTVPRSAEGLRLFESTVRPILIEHCYDCHSAEAGSAESGLRLDSPLSLRRGGERGPAVVPNKPNTSWLLTAIEHSDSDLQMPPKRPRLNAAVVADFRRWIELGAPDPRQDDPTLPSQSSPDANETWKKPVELWSHQPLTKPTPTLTCQAPGNGTPWATTPLDQYIEAGLMAANLTPSPEASPAVLLRRLHFDLVGLPPSPQAAENFRQRASADGFDITWQAEVERLLAAPQFGEVWGRHWLDVARFAESSGKEANISFPYAWRYRDYVLDCFNDDLPYNRFLTEQLAGDLLPYASDVERARLLIATGFLAVGAKNLDEMDAKQFTADVIDEQIDTVTRAVLASSIACARCHDHKFDPYSMRDYYALAGIFASTKTFFGTAVSPANRVGGDPLELPQVDGIETFHSGLTAEKVAALNQELKELRKEQQAGQASNMMAAIKGQKPEKEFTLRDALRIFWRSGQIEGQLEKVDGYGHPLPLAMGVLDRDFPRDAPLLERGDVHRPAQAVPRGVPEVLALDPVLDQAVTHDQGVAEDSSGRLQLAQWLTDPRHPLTARVRVNRIWSRLFGRGLVATVDDFGSTGDPPSHPELLDFLAREFMRDGGSTKHLVRELVLSRTYRQSSEFRQSAFEADPDNRWLWRMPKRRLPAEAIRDATLAVSGSLDLSRPAASLVGKVIGDRPIALIGLDKRLPPDLDGSPHRSVYLPVIRDRMPDVLELFDVASANFVTGQRETTNVPLQALYLLNSDSVRERARAMARRLHREANSDAARVQLAFDYCFSRPPTKVEQEQLLERLSNATAEDNVQLAWTDVCQALLATAEFRILD